MSLLSCKNAANGKTIDSLSWTMAGARDHSLPSSPTQTPGPAPWDWRRARQDGCVGLGHLQHAASQPGWSLSMGPTIFFSDRVKLLGGKSECLDWLYSHAVKHPAQPDADGPMSIDTAQVQGRTVQVA